MTTVCPTHWAHSRFGHLDDRRFRRRAVYTVLGIAARPAGTVTAVFSRAADREGVYRLLESTRVTPEQCSEALGVAAARASKRHRTVLVPVDGSSLNIVDTERAKGTGVIGSYRVGARGVVVQTALAVEMSGAPIDVAGQRYWTRDPEHKGPHELTHVVSLLSDVAERFARHAPRTRVWFQLDRGYDAEHVLAHFRDNPGVAFTIRSSNDRRVEDAEGKCRHLHETLAKAPALGTYQLPLSHRVASITVRAAKVTLLMPTLGAPKRISKTTLWVVEARENRRNGICWRLLTSEPAETFEQALQVIRGYQARWRVEEFHRAWKDGVCRVEQTQLRSLQAITKWAIFHAAVAARATRLTHLARQTPDAPAVEEFSPSEVTAVYALLRKKRPKDPPSLATLVNLVATLGGYIGKSSGGPPGATTISRGLTRVVDAAAVVDALKSGGCG